MNPFDSCNVLVCVIQRDGVGCLCESVAMMDKQHGSALLVHSQYLDYLLVLLLIVVAVVFLQQRYIEQGVDAVRFVQLRQWMCDVSV